MTFYLWQMKKEKTSDSKPVRFIITLTLVGALLLIIGIGAKSIFLSIVGVVLLLPVGMIIWFTMRGIKASRLPSEPLIEQLRIPVPANPPTMQIIESTSGRGKYKTDLSKQTCTCDRFRDYQRVRYQIGDIRRLCRHLCLLYCKMPEFEQLDPVKRAMIRNGFGIRTSISLLNVTKDGQPYSDAAFMYDKGNPWVDVFARGESGSIERFGYSTKERRWAYGDPPPDVAKQLKAEIMRTLRETQP